MKQLIPFFLLFVISINGLCNSTVHSTIHEVMVYRQSAALTRQAQFTTTQGTQKVILTGISVFAVPSSFTVHLKSSSGKLLSATYKKTFLLQEVDPKQKALKDQLQSQINQINHQLAAIHDQQTILKGMEKILDKNIDLGRSSSGFTPAQVIELSNNYQEKYLQIKTELRTLAQQATTLKNDKNRITKQVKEIKTQDTTIPTSNMEIELYSTSREKVTITCKYVVKNAGWKPSYELRAKSIANDVQLTYKAHVFQNTAQNWDGVKMTISTGSPSIDNSRPILNPLIAQISQYRANNQSYKVESYNLNLRTTNLAYASSSNAKVSSNIPTHSIASQLNIEYPIANKQTVNSDNQAHIMTLKNYQLPTEYIYHAVPKLNKGAFLLAKISGWHKHHLDYGTAAVFFENAYVGQSSIHPDIASDTLLVSMGRDANILVNRTLVETSSTSKFIGSTKKETLSYEISITNNKSVPIAIEVLDQIPISNNKLIEISLDQKGSASYLEAFGRLLWNLKIKPGKTKTEKFTYTVKSPKKEYVVGIK
ncbi:MAG: DUF4139 domain-containing protein [Flammeovirgaceae bacterium]